MGAGSAASSCFQEKRTRIRPANRENDPVRRRPRAVTIPEMELAMFTRTKTRTVHFDAPFTLNGLDGLHPAGDYRVLDDEEQMTGISWLAYRRVATMIEVVAGSKTSLITIDPAELEAALEKDKVFSAKRD